MIEAPPATDRQLAISGSDTFCRSEVRVRFLLIMARRTDLLIIAPF
jgi:hypothetical protein